MTPRHSILLHDRLAYSIAEVSVILGVSVRQVWVYFQKHGLPVRILGPHLRRITRQDLAAWCESQPLHAALVPAFRAASPEGAMLFRLRLKMRHVRAVLGVGEVAVLHLERDHGMPVQRSSQGTRPLATIIEIEAWLQTLPRVIPQAVPAAPEAAPAVSHDAPEKREAAG